MFMRVSELDPRVKNKRFFLPFLTLGTSTKLLGFMRVLAILDPLEISSGGCTPGKPASCVPQGRKGHSKINGADARYRLDQARASARRSKARFDSGGTPPRTRGTGSIRRGISRRCVPARGMPAFCLRQSRKSPRKSSAADVRDRLDQARRKPPLQGANCSVRARTRRAGPGP